ncbi:hypothetical protein [Burkholderia sp. ABCPW 14]|uniref:hypothetical protein n=1 Tax=Burkholderia sp. ABCPW 14 TaxID=1637860 RepID=UPI000B0BFEC7|nr:hypothetical protein [Burkholderia sp. ABCPW 14]
MLALKLTLVPLFLLVVSMSGRWWGPSIAGWLAGLAARSARPQALTSAAMSD